MQESTRHRLIQGVKRLANSLHKHARGCKVSPPQDCKACVKAIKWFEELPLPLLSIALEEEVK